MNGWKIYGELDLIQYTTKGQYGQEKCIFLGITIDPFLLLLEQFGKMEKEEGIIIMEVSSFMAYFLNMFRPDYTVLPIGLLITGMRFVDDSKSTSGQSLKGTLTSLPPGCSSFDLFKNHHDRANRFREVTVLITE